MTIKHLRFEEALSLYPDFLQAKAREQGVETVTALWILGDAEMWRHFESCRLPVHESNRLTKANQTLEEADDLDGLLEEFQRRTGCAAQIGSLLAWDETESWRKTWPGRLICRGGEHPNMASPLAIEVIPHTFNIFPAWVLTRRSHYPELRTKNSAQSESVSSIYYAN